MPTPAADLYVGLSELCYEHGDLEGANGYLQRSKELCEHGGISEHRHPPWFVAMARIKQAGGDLDGALDLLDEAERGVCQQSRARRASRSRVENAGVGPPGQAGRGAGVGPVSGT